MCVQGRGKSYVVLKAEEEVVRSKTSKASGLFIQRFKDPVLVSQGKRLLGQGTCLE